MRSRILVIANPVSGRGKGARLARALLGRLQGKGCTVDFQETRQAGDARRAAAGAAAFSAVACIGGDGTVNEVVNGLPPAGVPPLTMVPCGTANVLAKELGLPRDPERLADLIVDGPEVRWDLGVDHESGRKFLLFGSAGYDAHVVHLFHAARRGAVRMGQYILWGLKSILDYRVPRLRVEIDGRTLEGEASWVQVSNVASYGGPLVFTPRARADDGVFEVRVLRSNRRRDVVRMFWGAILGYLFGLDVDLGGVTFHRARRVRLASADGALVPVQVDGDPGGFLPADFEIVPGGIRILAPLQRGPSRTR